MTEPKNNIASIAPEINPEGEYYNHPLLIEEPPLQVLPALAEAIGLEEAIVIQQLRYLLRNPKNGKTVKGERWIFNTYGQWAGIFPFWSERTISRIFTRLEGMQLVISCQPEAGISRRKYYRLNVAMVNRLRKGTVLRPKNHAANLAASSGQVGSSMRPNSALPSTETTAKSTFKESEESKGTPSSEGVLSFPEISPEWMPKAGTKEQKLAILSIPKYPSESEFDKFLEDSNCYCVVNDRPELYSDLCNRKWHEWKKDARKWVPIRNWKAYVQALEAVIMNASGA